MHKVILFLVFFCSLPCTIFAQWEKIASDSVYVSGVSKIGAYLFTAQNTHSVYRSIDTGKHWQEIIAGIPAGYRISYCDRLMADNQYLYLLGTNNWHDYDRYISQKFFRLKWSDSVWEQFEILKPDSAMLRQIISLSDDSLLTVLSYPIPNFDDSIYLSTNKGKSWSNLNLILPHDMNRSNPLLKKIGEDVAAITYSGVGFLNRKIWNWNFRRPNIYDSATLIILNPSPKLFFALPYIFDSLYEPITLGLFRSIDLGMSWQSMDTTGMGRLNTQYFKVFDFDSLLLGEDQTISGIIASRFYVSSDRGSHWIHIIPPVSFPISYSTQTLYELNDRIIVVNYDKQYEMSLDLQRWKPYLGSKTALGFKPLCLVSGHALFAHAPENPYIASRFLSDTIYTSLDNGVSWEARYFGNYGYVTPGKWCEGNGFIFAGGINRDSSICVFKSSDLGKSWNQLSPLPTIFSPYYYISSLNVSEDTIFAVISSSNNQDINNELLISTDGGKTWVDLAKSLSQDHPAYGPSPQFSNGKVYAAVSIYPLGICFAHTTINPIHWIYDTLDTQPSFRINQLEALENQILIGTTLYNRTPNYVYVSGDEGKSWEISDYGIDRECIIESSFVSDTTIYFTGYYYGTLPEIEGYGRIFYSTNRGLNWKKLPSMFSRGNIFVGSEYIFYQSDALYRLPLSAIGPSNPPLQISNLILESVYPSPSNNVSYIRFSIPELAETSLKIYDVTGRYIATLANKIYDSGEFEVTWDTKKMITGTYLLILKSKDKVATRAISVIH
jgi:hypothetical protein